MGDIFANPGDWELIEGGVDPIAEGGRTETAISFQRRAGNELLSGFGGFKFSKTSDGLPGYIAPGGADSVIPFKMSGYIKVQSYGGR